jgi:hypothetical protein
MRQRMRLEGFTAAGEIPRRGSGRDGNPLFLLATLASVLLGGCELAEVAAPPSDDVLVVEAVLRAGRASQYVLLHRSIEGTLIRGESGARVQVVRDDGRVIVYEEAPLQACSLVAADNEDLEDLDLQATCYVNDASEGFFVRPGSGYELMIETTDGLIARGRTTLPEDFSFHSPAVPLRPRSLTADCTLPNEPFTLVWGKSEGAWAYVVMLELTGWSNLLPIEGEDAPDPLELLSVSVSASDTSAVVPVNIGLFQRPDLDQRIFELLEDGIPPGIDTRLVVMAADRNYTNAIRGGRFNPSGPVRISSVVGDAIGVFGGVVPLVIRSVNGAGETTPPCPMPT